MCLMGGREMIFFIDFSHQPMQMTRMMMMGRTSISLAAARALDAVEIDGRRRNRSGRHHRRHLKITTGKHNHVSLSTYLFFLFFSPETTTTRFQSLVFMTRNPVISIFSRINLKTHTHRFPISLAKIWAILNQKLMAKNQIVFESSSTRREIKRNGLAHFHFFLVFGFLFY